MAEDSYLKVIEVSNMNKVYQYELRALQQKEGYM